MIKTEDMYAPSHTIRSAIAGILACLMAVTGASAGPSEKPVAGQQVRFPRGTWSALPQLGPDGKVRQCVLVSLRQRAGRDGPIDTRFALNISRGAGLAIGIHDDGLPTEDVLDDQAEVTIDGRSFPAVGFPVGTLFVFHPGDAAGALTMLGKATQVRLRSEGAGIDSGPITIGLPPEALNWLKDCGRTFDIAIDKPTDPNAPELPTPRVRSPKIAVLPPTPAGPPGISDKQKIQGWDASELRNGEGHIIVCFIRRHYAMGSEPGSRTLGTFLMVSRLKGLTMMLKDSKLDQVEGKPVEASLKVGDRPFADFSAQVLGHDEIGIFPAHGSAFAAALAIGERATFKPANGDQLDFPVQPSALAWLRACARRNGIGLEPTGQ
jgi:hypothetical protein